MDHPPVCYISVDVETAGPNPSDYAMLSIGACVVRAPEHAFYVELQPRFPAVLPEALRVSGLSMERLAAEGVPPAAAMERFAGWLAEVVPPGQRPLLVGFNAPFDWMFVADYFHHFLGHNPFGHNALDLKALYAGAAGIPFEEASLQGISDRLGLTERLSHNALDDARVQAALCRRLLAGIGQR